MPRITLIHATPVAIEPVVAAFDDAWPEASIFNLLEDSLTHDLQAAGANDADAGIVERFKTLTRYAVDCGADAILFTCSAFGRAIEAAAAAHPTLPVLKPNAAMFQEALATGTRICMLATYAPSIPSMTREFEAMAKSANPGAVLDAICVPDAMAALTAGDRALHDRLIAQAAEQFTNHDVLLLAQFSMAPARAAVMQNRSMPVLTSPMSAIAALRRRLNEEPQHG